MYMELVCECPNQLRLGLLQAAILLMSNAARNSEPYDHRSWPAVAATPATGAPADPRTPPGSRTNWTLSEPAEPAEGTGSFFFGFVFGITSRRCSDTRHDQYLIITPRKKKEKKLVGLISKCRKQIGVSNWSTRSIDRSEQQRQKRQTNTFCCSFQACKRQQLTRMSKADLRSHELYR